MGDPLFFDELSLVQFNVFLSSAAFGDNRGRPKLWRVITDDYYEAIEKFQIELGGINVVSVRVQDESPDTVSTHESLGIAVVTTRTFRTLPY